MSLSVPRARVFVATLALALAVVCSPASAHGHRTSTTSLKLDPGAVTALTGLGVTPAPIAPARALAADELAFPITNSLGNALRTGVIRHSGGISLTAGQTTVALTDFNIELAKSRLTAMVGGARVPILALDFSRVRLSIRSGKLRLGPVGASLTPEAAGALNSAFGLPAGTVPAGLKLGDATVRYQLFGGWGHH